MKKNFLRSFLSLIWLFSACISGQAQPFHQPSLTSTSLVSSKEDPSDKSTALQHQVAQSTPLDLSFTQLSYPFPVHYFTDKIQNVEVKTAYMDVPAFGVERGVVILFHGKNFSSDYWDSTIADLSKAGYRVIAPDQIGFGKSSKPPIKYHFDELCQNTFKLIQHLGLKRLNVIANSMGGMVGVRFTVLYTDSVDKLILENPLGLEDYSKNIPPQTNETLLGLEMAQTQDSYSKFMHSYFPNWRPEYERFVENYVRIKNGPDYEAFSETSVRTYQMIADQPVVQDFPAIKPPTLLIIGQLDHTVFGRRFAPPEAVKTMGDFTKLGKQIASVVPNAKLIEIPNVGHVPHLEVHDLFIKHVLEFLN